MFYVASKYNTISHSITANYVITRNSNTSHTREGSKQTLWYEEDL